MESSASASASRCVARMAEGVHLCTLERYSVCKRVGPDGKVESSPFVVGGHQWIVSISPGVVGRSGHAYIALGVIRLSGGEEKIRVCFKMTLIDQSGKGNHMTCSSFGDTPLVLKRGQNATFPGFIRRDVLEKSVYLRDDCLKIECTIGVVLPPETRQMMPSFVNPDFGTQFGSMLQSGNYCDVFFDVRGERFGAHRVILSARSKVFKTMFARREVDQDLVITNVEPRVFKALLHFIYTDALLEDNKQFAAQLLDASNEYGVRRLKTICESLIWSSISHHRFGETLALADRCNASQLRHLCFKYAADNYAALEELNSFSHLQEISSKELLDELLDSVSKGKGHLQAIERRK